MRVTSWGMNCVICKGPRDLQEPIRARADGKGPACRLCIRQYEIDEKRRQSHDARTSEGKT